MMERNTMIVAVDGYSSTGKSTLARDIARHYAIKYIDSGAMYRAVTLFALRRKLYDPVRDQLNEERLREALEQIDIDFLVDPQNHQQYVLLDGENVEQEIRQMEVSQSVSMISRYGFIRRKLVDKQRAFARRDSLVMDGRDIGTVVFPGADVKIFMTASAEIRTRRRYDELLGKGYHVSLEEVRRNVEERDHVDETREESPLRKAGDAIVIDNSHLTRHQQLQKAVQIIEEKTGKTTG
ncbi:MAG: (d)CMP kinase [Bacteroidales bacterium]|nr:(d)CMP kinase [Bacteroidales bacterium]